jgi:hypothetical protein
MLIETPWLLILDNADGGETADLLKDYLPTGKYGSILITSRDSSLVPKFGGTIMGPLEEDDAAEMLLRNIRGDDIGSVLKAFQPHGYTHAARQIVRRLGFLPIGIMQAAQFIRKDNLKLEEFLDAYNERSLIAKSSELSTVWTMSYKSLSKEQQDLLNIMSFFDPDRIPQKMILEGAAKAVRNGNTNLEFITQNRRYRRCRSGLVKSSLIHQNEYIDELWIHRLVQQSCHIRMDKKSHQEAFEMALAILVAMWPMTDPDDRHQVDLWPLSNMLLPHVISLARFFDDSQTSENALSADPEILTLLFNASL